MRSWTALLVVLLGLVGSAQVAHAQLDVTFHTAATWGRYYPAHVMAVWVTSSDGSFERTLYVWAGRRRSHLAEWNAAHPYSESLDGITSATLRTDATQEVRWDTRDTRGATAPDGSYLLHFELADTNSTSANYHAQLAFQKSPSGFDQTLESDPFLSVHIVYTPPATPPPPPPPPPQMDAGVAPPPGTDAGVVVPPPPSGIDAGSSGPPPTGPGGATPVIPVGRGYGSRGCAAAPGGGGAAAWTLGALGILLVRRRR